LQKLLRLPQVIERTNLKRSTIYELMAKGIFPKPIKITGARLTTWPAHEIEAFIAQRTAEREAA
jgi:prophage regulatory protein